MIDTPFTDQQLNEITAREKAATPGPWGIYESGSLIDIAADLEDTGCGYRARREIARLEDEPLDNDPAHRDWTAEEDWAQVQADAAFVSHAREDVPALLAEVRRLRQQRRFLLDQIAKKDAASGAGDRALAEFLGAGPDIAAADNPTPLRWGLNDVLWGDDDTIIVLLSGPQGEPYWLELDPERAAALREDLAGSAAEQQLAEEAKR